MEPPPAYPSDAPPKPSPATPAAPVCDLTTAPGPPEGSPAEPPAVMPHKVSPLGKVLAAALGSLGGALLVVQGGVNTNLREKGISNPFATGFVSFAVGFLSLTTLACIHAPGCNHPAEGGRVRLSAAPWTSYLGGFLGPVYVVTAIAVVSLLGFSAFQLSATAGQLGTSMVCDAVGFLGIKQRSPTLHRMGAVVALGGGAALSVDISVGGLEVYEVLGLCILAACAGGIFPVQGCINAQLARHVGTPLRASVISFATGLFNLLIISGVSSAVSGGLDLSLGETEPWMWTGGMCGALMVTANMIGIPRLGAAQYTTIFIAAQLLTAFVLDWIGAFGLKQVEPTTQRVCGIALAVSAAVAYQWAGPSRPVTPRETPSKEPPEPDAGA
eukprot:Hpha_TRINITY_DN16802_c0_g2::TRINITY_DN16802_c0_g2_i1::g.151028::m.151028/K09936/TC.BAT2; bacterial/archaeal transporter family-2 protein